MPRHAVLPIDKVLRALGKGRAQVPPSTPFLVFETPLSANVRAKVMTQAMHYWRSSEGFAFC